MARGVPHPQHPQCSYGPAQLHTFLLKSHSDDDVSQKGLSVLCLLVFLHPNLFTLSTLIGTVYNKYLALIGLSIFIHFQNPDVSSFGIYVRLGFCYLSTFTWLLVALQEHIPLCNCCKETKQHLHHNF